MKTLRTTTPWTPVPALRADDWIRRAFEELQSLQGFPTWAAPDSPTLPRADLLENDHQYALRFELPGIAKNDISLRIEDGVFELKAERRDSDNGGSFSVTRSIRLPGPVTAEQATAKLEDGILTVLLPRAEDAKPKCITIE